MARTLTLTSARRGHANEWGAIVFCPPPKPEGQAGQMLFEAAQEAFAHLADTSSFGQCVSEPFDEASYEPVPPRLAFVAKVKYVYRGKGTPMPFDLDE